MYLSRIKLDTKRRETLQALESPQLFHGAVEQSFDGSRQRNLWRTDWVGDACHLLVLSAGKPNLTRVAEQFGDVNTGISFEAKEYYPLLERLQAGQTWKFRLRANPVHSSPSEKEGDGKRGKLYAHVTQEQQKMWLMKRATSYGFSLESDQFDVVHTQWVKFRKSGDSNREVTLRTATFEGVLTITDADIFRQSLVNGIGRAKAYGCGLLTIARAGGY